MLEITVGRDTRIAFDDPGRPGGGWRTLERRARDVGGALERFAGDINKGQTVDVDAYLARLARLERDGLTVTPSAREVFRDARDALAMLQTIAKLNPPRGIDGRSREVRVSVRFGASVGAVKTCSYYIQRVGWSFDALARHAGEQAALAATGRAVADAPAA